MYDDSECGETFNGPEGFVNSTFVSKEKSDYVIKHNLQLDCMWVIEVKKDWRVRRRHAIKITPKSTGDGLAFNLISKIFFQIQLSFVVFKLEKPNDCDHNFVDVFGENTDIPSR